MKTPGAVQQETHDALGLSSPIGERSLGSSAASSSNSHGLVVRNAVPVWPRMIQTHRNARRLNRWQSCRAIGENRVPVRLRAMPNVQCGIQIERSSSHPKGPSLASLASHRAQAAIGEWPQQGGCCRPKDRIGAPKFKWPPAQLLHTHLSRKAA